MSIPPLPAGLEDTVESRTANALHSLAIHLLRRARLADRRTGLSPERLSLLSVLVFAGSQTVGALALMEGVSAPAISRIASLLEKLGLARRERGGEDAREVRLSATAKGKRLMEEGRRRRLELIAEDLKGLSRRDLSMLGGVGDVLQRLNARKAGQ